ncbi:MAG TPA: ankyrin repeat domain-containing protein, partial [Vicinamibacteria bacterium]|nr:ankyrin repeat domain-containing protein [Vicinamibacteria bacterium]
MKRRAAGLVLGAVMCVSGAARAQSSKADEELLKAAKKGDVAKIESLVGAGANVNARNKDGRTPLIEATREGKLPEVKAL